MNRSGKALVLAATLTLALSGCGGAATAETAEPAVADVAAEAVALQAVGFTTDEDNDPAPRTKTKDGVRPKAVRKLLRRNALHGEVTVQTKAGVQTVVVQRGTVDSVSDQGVTVVSSDGFKLTWSYGDPLRIVQQRKAVGRDALKDGAQVGIGGLKDGSATTARLIVVKPQS